MTHLFTNAPDELFRPAPATPESPLGPCVRIAVERGIDAPETAEGLTYLAGGLDLHIGQRVEVPLGRGNRPAPGIVITTGGAELLEGIPASRAKRVLRALGPGLPPPLIELAQWIAAYYCCPLGIVFSTMMPASVKRGVGLRRHTEVLPVSPDAAAAILGSTHLRPSAQKAWDAIIALGPDRPTDPRALAAAISARTIAPINQLIKAGLLEKHQRTIVRGMPQVWQNARINQSSGPHALTPAQSRIADGIASALGSFSVHLLRGITGSGKTEVYMTLIDRVLAQGRCAIVLVPEISLTPQTAGRFLARFGQSAEEGRVAVLHSGMPASERHRQWTLAATGRARLIVGARSAIFAPITNLGLIVVDEEHATDYKQDQSPRYNGRDVAIVRGRIEKCPVLLGSATPSLESWANTQRPGPHRHHLWELTERVGGGALPPIEIIDLAAEQRARAKEAPGRPRDIIAVGPRLEAALRQTIAEGGQAILLLNRRGFASCLSCSDTRCGWVAACESCDSTMVLHRRRDAHRTDHSSLQSPVDFIRCHHCLAEQIVPVQCAVCGKPLIRLGAGTQRLEEELTRRLHGILSRDQVIRLDSDTMRSASDWFDVLQRFGSGRIRILMGTQMIAKGLDFPNVRLVGVINADTGLAIPDFRSAERTFQLVSQVAGRAGRGIHPGRVIVQTLNPSEPAIQLAARHDYTTFAARELAIRRRAHLPPAARMARIIVRNESLQRARDHAQEIAAAIAGAATACTITGPAPCPIARIDNEYRIAIDLTAHLSRDIAAALAAARSAGLLRAASRTIVDVDPIAIL